MIAAYIPAVAVSPTYDDHGNLLTDGRFTYTWDGELSRGAEAKWTTNGSPQGKFAKWGKFIKIG